MAIQLSDEAKALLDEPNYAHLATLLGSGGPHVSPVWVQREDNLILIGTGGGTAKARNTLREPRIAMSITAQDNPYRQLQIRGRIVERRPDDDFAVMDRIAYKYTQEPFPWKHLKGRLVLVVEPEHERLEEIPFKHRPA